MRRVIAERVQKRSGAGTVMLACLLAMSFGLERGALARQSVSSPTASSAPRQIGAIKAIDSNAITLAADDGQVVHVLLEETTKILRVAPGEKDLKNATPARLADLQVGDRVLVRGKPSDDAHSVTATTVVVMKQADVAATQERQREDWQKRGVGGLVTVVDTASGTVTISAGGFGAARTVAVHTTKETILRRYTPNSTKFDDAKPAPLDQIKPGDQLRARGARSADGNEISAEEVVSGTFRNIAGPITMIDAATHSVTIQDAISKKPIVIKFSPDSQLKQLPEEFAQRIAMRLRGAGDQAGQGSSPSRASAGAPGQGPGGSGTGRGGRMPDLQQILNRMPAASLEDLKKGDVVMLVSTPGDASGEVTVITALAGVEPILRASPGNAQTVLSPWTLGSSNAEAASP